MVYRVTVVDTPIRATRWPVAPAWLVALVAGTAVGVATSFGQAVLDGAWAALVNSASPWLVVAFAAGACARRMPVAVPVGMLACLCEVAGYYVVTAARGYAVAESEIVFWSACAIVGGPLFGAAGLAWWRRSPVGTAVPGAAFLAESLGLYASVLHYWSTAILYAAIAVPLTAVLAIRTVGSGGTVRIGRWWHVAGCLAVFTAVGVVGEYLLARVAGAVFS